MKRKLGHYIITFIIQPEMKYSADKFSYNLPRFKQAVREGATICPRPCKLTFDLLTLKVVSESHVTWATSVPILVLLDLSVLDLGPMYATDRRQTSDRQTSDAHHLLMSPTLGVGHSKLPQYLQKRIGLV